MSRLTFPYRPQPVSEELRRRMAAAYPVYREEGLVPFGPSGFVAPADALPFLEDYYNTPVAPEDVWIVTLPKCGKCLDSGQRLENAVRERSLLRL